jgi:two-component system chemotaxis sensor kinase CheA
MDDMDPIINEFLIESHENLDQLDRDLVDLEAHPGEKNLLASVFRTIHTIKGTCGFLGFAKLESITHVSENLLSKLRDGELDMTPDITNALLTMVDAVREILSNIEKNRSEGDIDYSDLVELMAYLQSGGNPESKKTETLKADGERNIGQAKTPAEHSLGGSRDNVNPILSEFLAESYENLNQLDRDLVDLEAHPREKSLLASIFRAVHTIKGTCSFLGFNQLESIAHVGEKLLSKLINGDLDMTPDIANSLLAMVDAVREILSNIENNHSEGGVDYSGLVESLAYLQSGENPETYKIESLKADKQEYFSPPEESAAPFASGSLFERLGGQNTVDTLVDKFFDKVLADSRIKIFFEGIVTERLRNKKKSYWAFAFGGESQFTGKSLREAHQLLLDKGLSEEHFEAMIGIFNETLCEMDIPDDLVQEACKIALSTRDEIFGKARGKIVESVPATEDAPTIPEEKELKPRGGTDRRMGNIKEEETFLAIHKDRRGGGDRRSESIRVGVDLLDRLMNLVGELVLARNQMIQFAVTQSDPSFRSTTQHLDQLTSELQEGVMKTRMQPIGNVWNKFPRVVRDLAALCGKKVHLEMEGKETELDKTLIEAIKDPLTHIVRNSVDHGIEMPDERIAKGKSPEGRLSLRAFHEGGQVNIEIVDDGGGIDPEIIKTKALGKNLITPQEAARLTDRELINLIFTPGFSTAEAVSNLSGRGVGMDVVKSNIERIGGTAEIQSKVGQGAILKIKMPLTLAIIPALIVTCGALRYAIPQVNLLELVGLESIEGETAIEYIQGSPVYRLRGNLLPLVYLNKLLQIESQSKSNIVNIAVLQVGSCQFGLVVDGINDTEEIVVKPLGKQLENINIYTGATIMGDGKVVLILDAMGMAQRANVVDQESRDHIRKDAGDPEEAKNADRQALLVFSPGNETRMAVPLSRVERLEEFNLSMLENSDGKQVVQYRGDIMPVIFLSDVFDIKTSRKEDDILRVIVYSDRGRSVGVVVDKIIDIVEEVVTLKEGLVGQGLLGSTVVQNKVTDLLDVEGVIRRVDPEFYNNPAAATSNNIEKTPVNDYGFQNSSEGGCR